MILYITGTIFQHLKRNGVITMRRNKYRIVMTIDDNDFGSLIVKARNENEAYIKFMKILIKNRIALHSRVEIEIEKI
jgi:hypothetical protein